jgi:hypothetical protein
MNSPHPSGLSRKSREYLARPEKRSLGNAEANLMGGDLLGATIDDLTNGGSGSSYVTFVFFSGGFSMKTKLSVLAQPRVMHLPMFLLAMAGVAASVAVACSSSTTTAVTPTTDAAVDAPLETGSDTDAADTSTGTGDSSTGDSTTSDTGESDSSASDGGEGDSSTSDSTTSDTGASDATTG